MWHRPRAMGAVPTAADAVRLGRSPNYRDGAFQNRSYDGRAPGAHRPGGRGIVRQWRERGPQQPAGAVPLVRGRAGETSDDLRLTWLGHATTLVEIEGHAVLFDPVWSARCSPVPGVGPRRMHAVPMALADLPALTAIVISHDHYDHLDLATVTALTRRQRAPFVVPLGVGGHLRRWGVPEERVIELDWDGHAELGALRLTSTVAQHFSGRGLARNPTLWSSWVVAGQRRRVFYTGDTGYFPGFAEIGAAHGPFDATLVQVGAYGVSWPDIHMTPEDGLTAHRDVGGRLLVPVHWGTFSLAFHAWSEPVERLLSSAAKVGVPVAVPRPGQPIDVAAPPAVDHWWRAVASVPRPARLPIGELVDAPQHP
ncbi:Zn-dependent hydrolase [Pilimelia terevasa]|uniref:Zn-dependent hydrolase n=1 Tax=Pilimelia terevasa TaxID=53372 RepID=A0A8J3FKD5_9ACTN|nr:MBL fold metallo-hydrolase [Pilimelia terevasa]GGK39030.1 Zn-dependent hydrolase [Pilimelia terevasa]